MRTSRELAQGLIERYEKVTRSNFGTSELKLHIMMYFVQRQSLAYTGKPMIEESFIGWVHGPGLESLRFLLEESRATEDVSLNDDERFIIDGVIYEYGKYSAWELKELVMSEVSWSKSRESLGAKDSGSVQLSTADIEQDAIGIRIYDPLFDMYIDEFDDIDHEVI